jgi:hypothetical protein
MDLMPFGGLWVLFALVMQLQDDLGKRGSR